MQYRKYEKLIVVENGVELINWPGSVPFIGISDLVSFHHLHSEKENVLTRQEKSSAMLVVTNDKHGVSAKG